MLLKYSFIDTKLWTNLIFICHTTYESGSTVVMSAKYCGILWYLVMMKLIVTLYFAGIQYLFLFKRPQFIVDATWSTVETYL